MKNVLVCKKYSAERKIQIYKYIYLYTYLEYSGKGVYIVSVFLSIRFVATFFVFSRIVLSSSLLADL